MSRLGTPCTCELRRVWEYSQTNAAQDVRAEGAETGMQLSDRQRTLFVIKVLLTNKKNEVLCGFKNLVIDYFCGFHNPLLISINVEG